MKTLFGVYSSSLNPNTPNKRNIPNISNNTPNTNTPDTPNTPDTYSIPFMTVFFGVYFTQRDRESAFRTRLAWAGYWKEE